MVLYLLECFIPTVMYKPKIIEANVNEKGKREITHTEQDFATMVKGCFRLMVSLNYRMSA